MKTLLLLLSIVTMLACQSPTQSESVVVPETVPMKQLEEAHADMGSTELRSRGFFFGTEWANMWDSWSTEQRRQFVRRLKNEPYPSGNVSGFFDFDPLPGLLDEDGVAPGWWRD